MGDTFCSLCGVPFGISSDLYDDRISEDELSWTEEFCALVQGGDDPQTTTDNTNPTEKSPIWCLTTNGRGIPPDGVFKPPPFSAQESNPDDEPVVAFKVREGLPDYHVAYPMHPPCLEILKQQYFQCARGTSIDIDMLGRILSSQPLNENERGLKPDWSGEGYLGAEQFWRDGWDWMEEPLIEDDVDDIEDYDYLVQDPSKVKGFDLLLQNPPTTSTSRSASPVTRTLSAPVTDCFQSLPQELLSIILCYLSASSVKSARLASRTLANVPLSDVYWHSRFDFPFELSHIDWDPSWISGRTEEAPIDWPSFCSELVHPDESEFGWWRNRKRIASLMKSLSFRILQEQGAKLDAKDPTEEETETNVVCRQELSVASSSINHSTNIIFGLQLPLEEIREISIAFKHTQDTELACGISFHGTSRVVTVGQCNTKNIQTAILEHGCTFAGFMLAMNRRGIIGVQVLVSTRQGVHALETTLGLLADDWNPSALGQLAPIDHDSKLYGLRIATSKQNTIISIGLLEFIDRPEEIVGGQCTLPHFGNLWQPSVPPDDLFITVYSGLKDCDDFQYSQQVIFAERADSLKFLNRVMLFFDLFPPGLTGVQYQFDDKSSIPLEAPFRGKGVDFFVDGLGGERICGVDVFWGDEEQCLGISFITNRGRRSPFNETLIIGDIRVERQVPPAGTLMTGMYMRITHDDGNLSRCIGVGILCTSGEDAIPAESLPPPEVPDTLDDHFNAWMGGSHPSPELIFGETIGCQPNHGFVNWICFDQPIETVTACLGSHASNQTSKDSLVGLKVEIKHSLSAVLGRHTSLGSKFTLAGHDEISEVTVTVTVSNYPEIIGLRFKTRDGIESGKTLCGKQIHQLGDHQKRSISLKSRADLILVGLAWSYDLGPLRPAWHGVQGIYKLKDSTSKAIDLLQDLYPSMAWIKPPPGYLQLRPIPEMRSNGGPFESSVPEVDKGDRKGDIASISVFFNAFLQGVEFTYHGGCKESVGNLIGQFQIINLESGEEIRSVEIYERVRSLFANAANPREVVCVEGIKFGFRKRVNEEIYERSSPYCGPNQPFGPFLHRQGGLWQAAGHDSADWSSVYRLQTRNIVLDCSEVFEGLYTETLPTLVKRVGVLISRKKMHSDDQPEPSHNPPRSRSLLNTQAKNDRNEIPWLGNAPLPSSNLIPRFLEAQGTYRLWSAIPHDLKSYTVYRQLIYTPEPRRFVIGIEFHSQRPGFNTLLGFRSMQKEEALAVSMDGEAVGLSFRETEGSGEFRGLETVELLTLAMSKEVEDSLIVTEPKKLQGVYAIFGERIHAIGILQN